MRVVKIDPTGTDAAVMVLERAILIIKRAADDNVFDCIARPHHSPFCARCACVAAARELAAEYGEPIRPEDRGRWGVACDFAFGAIVPPGDQYCYLEQIGILGRADSVAVLRAAIARELRRKEGQG